MEPMTSIYKQRLSSAVKPIMFEGNLFTGDDGANVFVIEIWNGERPEYISDEVKAIVTRPDGTQIEIDGTAEGNVASVRLSKACYEVVGNIEIAILIGNTTIALISAAVYPSTTNKTMNVETEV